MKKTQYRKALASSMDAAGIGDRGWSGRFLDALEKNGLKLVIESPEVREDGCDYMAPVPMEGDRKYSYPAWIIPKEQ